MADGSGTAAFDRKLPRRFYADVTVASDGGSHAVLLDGRVVMTPGKVRLDLPNSVFAEAVAAEWFDQADEIRPWTMPLTAIANAALDRVCGAEEAVVQELVSYAARDLVLYRASSPQELVDRQQACWDPVIAGIEALTDAGRFRIATGIVPVDQLEPVLEAFGTVLAREDAFRLAAQHLITTMTGSALLSCALARGSLAPDAAWEAAHVDEDWQIERWGTDVEAMKRRDELRRNFDAAARVLTEFTESRT